VTLLLLLLQLLLLLLLLLLLVCTPANVDRVVSLGIRTASMMCTRPTPEAP